MKQEFNRIINASISTKQQILADENLQTIIEETITVITEAFQKGHKVLFCGNGGSAADAQHLAAEFSGRFYKDRKALPSEALHCNTSYLTAVANDYSYDVIYSRLIEGLCVKGDVLVGLSTSGNSKNILNAFAKAKEMGVITIGMTGASGGKMKEAGDYLINVPSSDTPRIQESHIMIGHIICELVEANIFGKP
jgi:D-sedoheptulose 7-phosphate isomerase